MRPSVKKKVLIRFLEISLANKLLAVGSLR